MVLVISSCAALSPQQVQQQASPTPTPSPSPTPTTPIAVSTPPFHGGEVGVGYAPSGSSFTVGGGYVTVTIPNRLISGYGALWTFVLTDQSPCSSGTYCKSAAATVAIGVQCG
jgi:hypothetical protein